MISNWLSAAVFGEELIRSGTDLLSIVKAIVCCTCFDVIYVGSIFVWEGFGECLVNQVRIRRFTSWLTSQTKVIPRCFAQFSTLAQFSLIVSFPVLGASLEKIVALSIAFSTCFLSLSLIEGFALGCACKVEGTVGSFFHNIRMVILGFCIFDMAFLI